MESEQELNLMDLIFYILYRWKKIVLIALIMAVLIGTYQMLSAKRSNASISDSAENATYQEKLEAYEAQLAAAQGNVDTVNESITAQEKYIQESILMNMDASNYYEGLFQAYIVAEKNSALVTLKDLLNGSDVRDSIADSIGWEVQYLIELVSVTLTVDSDNNKEGLLRIKVAAPTQDEATELLNLYVQAYESAGEEVTSTIAGFDATIMSNLVSKASSTSYTSSQKTAKDTLTSYRTNLASYQKTLDALVAPEAPTTVTPVSTVKAGIKGAVIGAVLGVILVGGCCCVSFVTGDRIYSPDELKERKQVKIMGVLPDAGSKKRGPVIKALRKLEGRKTDANEDKEWSLIAANVNNYRTGAQVIMVTGTAEKAVILKAAKELRDRMPDVKVMSAGNMLTEASTLTHLPVCDGVLLVETVGKSRYKDLGLEIEKIQDMEKQLIGCVVMD